MLSRNPFDLLADAEASATAQEYPKKTTAVSKTLPISQKTAAPKSNSFEQAPAVGASARQTGSASRGKGRAPKPSTRGSRTMDKHSRTDRIDGEKKEVAGTGSWGDPIKSELDAELDSVQQEEAIAEQEENDEPAEPEIEHKTLEEYLAERNASRKAPAIAPREVNAGVDSSQIKEASVLLKEEENFIFMSKPKAAAKVKSKPTKEIYVIEQKFSDQEQYRGGFSGRGGRGGATRGRGAGRGRGASGSGRGGRPVNFKDTRAFPSLQ